MELRQLRYFVALVEEASFTRAARRVHVTQSTLSHQIRQIEDELGKPLFDRIGKRIMITPAGEAFLQHATRALGEIDEGIKRMRMATSPPSATLRVGATHAFTIGAIPECLAEMLRRHPEIQIHLRELFADAIAAQVESGELDIGITYDPQRPDTLSFEPLYLEELVLAVAPTHPFANRKRLRLVELHQQRVILPTQETSTRRMIDAALSAIRARPVVVAEINSIAAAVGLARRSSLAAVVARVSIPGTEDVRFVPLESPNPLRTPGIVLRIGANPPPGLHPLVAVLRRVGLRREQP